MRKTLLYDFLIESLMKPFRKGSMSNIDWTANFGVDFKEIQEVHTKMLRMAMLSKLLRNL